MITPIILTAGTTGMPFLRHVVTLMSRLPLFVTWIMFLRLDTVQGTRIGHNSKEYEFVSTDMNYEAAEDRCQAGGGHLAKISRTMLYTEDFSVKMKSLLQGTECAWIGMTDREREGDWRWFDGSPVVDVKWRGLSAFLQKYVWDCGFLCDDSDGWSWAESVCTQDKRGICEYEIKTSTATSHVRTTGRKTSTHLAQTTGTKPVTSPRKTTDNALSYTTTTGHVSLSTEKSVTNEPHPKDMTTVRSYMLISLAMGSSKMSQPDWTMPSQSLVVCCGFCLSKVPLCQVIAFSKLSSRCMGYKDRANLFSGDQEIQTGFEFLEMYRLSNTD